MYFLTYYLCIFLLIELYLIHFHSEEKIRIFDLTTNKNRKPIALVYKDAWSKISLKSPCGDMFFFFFLIFREEKSHDLY